MPEVFSAKEVAIQLGTDARTLRKFLRDITPAEDQPGQGGRWNFSKGQIKKLTKQFSTWSETKKVKETPVVGDDEGIEEEIVDDDDEDFEEFEPEDDDLEEIEDDDIEEL